tara:strand:- start:301 stop:564 length:264 start_codon:yes stop_codon:yes gene_type:complete
MTEKRYLAECDTEEAEEIEHFVLNALDKHANHNPVAIIIGLANALLTIAARLGMEKRSFFHMMFEGWDVFNEMAEDERKSTKKEKLH